DLSSGRVEDEDDAMRERSILTKRAAQIICHPAHDWPRPLDIERGVLLVEVERRAGWPGASADAALAGASGGASAASATAAARQARRANVESRATTQPDRVW